MTTTGYVVDYLREEIHTHYKEPSRSRRRYYRSRLWRVGGRCRTVRMWKKHEKAQLCFMGEVDDWKILWSDQ